MLDGVDDGYNPRLAVLTRIGRAEDNLLLYASTETTLRLRAQEPGLERAASSLPAFPGAALPLLP